MFAGKRCTVRTVDKTVSQFQTSWTCCRGCPVSQLCGFCRYL